MKKALIIVDVQNDFCPGGALEVKDGDQVVPIINRLQKEGCFDMVVATQDWHPYDHKSFARNHNHRHVGEVIELFGVQQMLWPAHCVQESEGARFHPELLQEKWDLVIQKGMHSGIDSYSAFYENDKKTSTGLAKQLKDEGITEVYIVGLATDYCVRATAWDAKVMEGLVTQVIIDACRGVEVRPGDIGKAIDELRQAGVIITTSDEVLSSLNKK